MPSPFPGMDPYLENPHTWPNFHFNLISSFQAALNKRLRPKYVAQIEDRVYSSDMDDPGQQLFLPPEPQVDAAGRKIKYILLDEEIREHRIAILDVATRSTVTVIEALRPGNKCLDASARKSYMKARQEILASQASLVEIDLLRDGVSAFDRGNFTSHHYSICISDKHVCGPHWFMTPYDRLPAIDIPLKKDDGHAKLDLQLAFAEAYKNGGYDGVVDYSKPPVPPLTGVWIAWAKSLVARTTP